MPIGAGGLSVGHRATWQAGGRGGGGLRRDGCLDVVAQGGCGGLAIGGYGGLVAIGGYGGLAIGGNGGSSECNPAMKRAITTSLFLLADKVLRLQKETIKWRGGIL